MCLLDLLNSIPNACATIVLSGLSRIHLKVRTRLIQAVEQKAAEENALNEGARVLIANLLDLQDFFPDACAIIVG